MRGFRAVGTKFKPRRSFHRISDFSRVCEGVHEDLDKKVLRDYTREGRLTKIPSKQKKLLAVLRWLVGYFEPDCTYTEREVNDIIAQVHDDYATLRRDLVDFGFLRRERGGGQYWLTPEDEEVC